MGTTLVSEDSWPALCGMFTVMLSQNALPRRGAVGGLFRAGPHFIWSVFAVWPPHLPLVLACSPRGHRGFKRREHKVGRRGGDCYWLPVTRLDLAISTATLIDDGPWTNKASVLSIGGSQWRRQDCSLSSEAVWGRRDVWKTELHRGKDRFSPSLHPRTKLSIHASLFSSAMLIQDSCNPNKLRLQQSILV